MSTDAGMHFYLAAFYGKMKILHECAFSDFFKKSENAKHPLAAKAAKGC